MDGKNERKEARKEKRTTVRVLGSKVTCPGGITEGKKERG